MKKLIVALMVLSTLASCGKNNKVASPAPAAASPATTAITTTDQLGVALGQKIDNHTTQFGVGLINAYTTIGQLANQGVAITYKYTKSTASASPECEKKWIFTLCTSTSVTSFNPTVSRTVTNSGVNVSAKVAELKDIINRKHAAYPIQVSGYAFFITTSDNKQYVIDTRMPIQANPVGIRDTAGTEYMFRYEY